MNCMYHVIQVNILIIIKVIVHSFINKSKEGKIVMVIFDYFCNENYPLCTVSVCYCWQEYG